MGSSIHYCFALLWAVALATSCAGFQPLLPQQQHQIARSTLIETSMSEEPDAAKEPEAEETMKPEVVCPNCDLCDGSGRIAGGIGAVLPWIPIKAFRPCPNFIEGGGKYQRAGQGLDEIAFGKGNLDKWN